MRELSDPQNAYREKDGPILLLAGPGTGKSYQLKHRIRYLVEELNINPREITVISFTNESAKDLREKLNEFDKERNCVFLKKDIQPQNILTMHSLGNAILATSPEKIGLRNDYSVITEDEVIEVLIKDAALMIGFEGNEWKKTKKCRQIGKCERDPDKLICQICEEYKKILKRCNAVDYDSQILAACSILKKYNSIANQWRKKTKYLLVDEYQDINFGQYELIKLLSEGQRNGLFAVGDDDQSIYTFRGSSPVFIKEFEKYFGADVKVGRLSISYRCPEHILKGAKKIIEVFYKDSEKKPEPTFSNDIKVNKKIRISHEASDNYEAKKIAKIVDNKLNDNKSVIIIVPTKDYVIKLKTELHRRRLNYTYKAKPNKDGAKRFIDMANWLENSNCNWRLRHIIHHIIRNNNKIIKLVNKNGGIKGKKQFATKIVAGLWNKVNNKRSLMKVLERESLKNNEGDFISGLHECLLNLQASIKNGSKKISEFLKICGDLLAPGNSPKGLIKDLKSWYNEIAGLSMMQSTRCVNIYNLPSSKGLEADIVFVVGLEEGLMPRSDKNIEEEARLFYVAMTRAKEELFLFSSKNRSPSSTKKGNNFKMEPSQFIRSIPVEHKTTT